MADARHGAVLYGVLDREAEWVGRQLDAVAVEDLSPLLSIGSGNAASRARQPWIEQHVYGPLADRGVKVIHHEHEAAPGVDVAGDLTDPSVVDDLVGLGARSILCLNVLEHLADPQPIADALAAALPAGGRLVVSVPRRYPYHPDPIDTMLRPSVDELAARFPSLRVVAGEEVRCESLLRYALAVRGKGRMLANSERARQGAGLWQLARYAIGATAVTCAVFASS